MTRAAELCAIAISHRPDELSFRCLERAMGLVPHMIVVDNGSDETARAKLRELARPGVTLIENPTNIGVAAALNLGVETAIAMGHTWFLLLDQDTELFATGVADLQRTAAECREELGDRFGLLGSNFHLRLGDGRIEPAKVPYQGEGKGWEPQDLIITAGTVFDRGSFEAIGPFRDDLFIGHVDSEYCLRARQKGRVVAQTIRPVAIQRMGLQTQRRVPWALGARKWIWGESPLRRYYRIRNFLYLARRYEQDFPECIGTLRRGLRRDTWRALKYEGRLASNLVSIALAWDHDRRRIAGRYGGRLLS